MIKKHEIILSFALSIVMVACIIIVGVVTFNRVEYEVRVCLENSSMESPVNCTLLNEQQHSGVVENVELAAGKDNDYDAGYLDGLRYAKRVFKETKCFGVEK